MHWWKQHPPGWFAWDRWYQDDPEGGDGGGGDGDDDDDDDDSGGDGGDDDDDDAGDGDDSGDWGGDFEFDPGDSGDNNGGDFGGGDFDSDGDAGDDTAVAREWEADQRSFEREMERDRERQEAERERDRLAEEMERERQRIEEERRRQEEERRRAEAEAERQRRVAEQERLIESYRLQEQQQNGVNFGDQPGGVMLRNPLDMQQAEQPQSENVILTHKGTGFQSRLPREQLQFVTNQDEFDIRDDTAPTPLSLEQPQETSPIPPRNIEPTTRTTTGLIGDILEQNPPQELVAPPGTTGQAGLFDSRPSEQPQSVPAPEQAAQNAAAAVAATGAPPETVAATAELAARMASDRQTLADQSPWTRAAFRSEYGDRAEQEWARQHEAELDRNQRLYGSREPTAGIAPLSGAPAGTPVAPDRRIGIVPAPGPSETAQYGLPARRATAGVTPSPAVVPANALGVEAIGSVPVPTTASAQAAPTTAQAAPTTAQAAPTSGWTPLPGQTPRQPSAPTSLPAARDPRDPPIPPGSYNTTPPPTPGETDDIPIDTTQHGELENPYNRRTVVVATGPDNVDHAFTLDEWSQQDPEVKNQYRDVGMVDLDPEGRVLAPLAQQGGAGQGGPTSLPTPDIVTTIPQATASDRPIDALASMALVGRGENSTTETVRRDSYNIAQGISALLSGKPAGAWTEPYLNDIARLAYAREEAANGRTTDPRDAPVEYIEKWKDAFYGADARVPMIKELNQQMIDYAAVRTPPGQPFRWQEAYGPNGDRGLISRQVTAVDCGPNAFATILRSRGYNADPAQTFSFARQTGYHNGSEFTGPDNMVRMLRQEAGLNASSVSIAPNGQNWDRIDQELAEGRPVMLSSPGHYWVVSAKDPTTGKYYAGATTLRRNPEWMARGGFSYGGAADRAIFASGDVDPNSNAVRSLNLKPPASSVQDTRALLSRQTLGYEAPAQSTGSPSDTQMLNAPGTRRVSDTQMTPVHDPNLKPRFTVDETMEMRNRILNEMPDIKFEPNDDIETRLAKMVPALDWLEATYGVSAEALAGMAVNESGVGTAANAPAGKANNLWSTEYMPSDSQSTGPIPQGRWAAYPSVKAALARFVGMYAHPENGYRYTWQNRQNPDALLDALVKDKYVVDEPGFPVSVWYSGVNEGRSIYRRVKERSRGSRQ